MEAKLDADVGRNIRDRDADSETSIELIVPSAQT
jgi:hypothetical protein